AGVLVERGRQRISPDTDWQRRRIKLAVIPRARNLHRMGKHVSGKPCQDFLGGNSLLRKRLVKYFFQLLGRSSRRNLSRIESSGVFSNDGGNGSSQPLMLIR